MKENWIARFTQAVDDLTQKRLTRGEERCCWGGGNAAFAAKSNAINFIGWKDFWTRSSARSKSARPAGPRLTTWWRCTKAVLRSGTWCTKYKGQCAGARSYSLLKTVLQDGGVVKASKCRSKRNAASSADAPRPEC